MKYYALFDGNKELVTRYTSEIHGDAIPPEAVEITEAVFYKTILENDGIWYQDAAGAIRKKAFPAPVVEPVRVMVVSGRQGQLELLESGKLDLVDALIEGITDPKEKRKAQIEFNGPEWHRDSEFLQNMWAALGGTEQELDDLFTRARER